MNIRAYVHILLCSKYMCMYLYFNFVMALYLQLGLTFIHTRTFVWIDVCTCVCSYMWYPSISYIQALFILTVFRIIN